MLVLVPKNDRFDVFFAQYFLLLQYIVSSGKDSRVYLWELSTGKKNFKTINFYLFLFYFVFYCGFTLPLKSLRVTGF